MTIETTAMLMRTHESAYEQHIAEDHFIIVRLDGRGFSAFTEKHYQKPFDQRFHDAMIQTAKRMMEEFEAEMAYVASDEISLLFAPSWKSFDRRVEKITSLMAAMASVTFSQETSHMAIFDARVVSFATRAEVDQYFSLRLSDVQRCALQTTAYWTLRTMANMSARQAARRLDTASVAAKRALLIEYGIVYDTLPIWQREGVTLEWEEYQKVGYNPLTAQSVMATRRRIILGKGLNG